ncbi:MAG: succinate dehydrogenase [Planctomycetaceae bacterium]|nr:succinate dehydrogenase [Planctomycetaceae bacterium]
MTNEHSFIDRHYLLLRRLHSLSGIFPIGLFLIPHLTTNSSIVWGRLGYGGDVAGGVETFQHEVDFIHSLPALLLIEVFGLWLPLGFHAVLGVYFARTGRFNTNRYSYQSNWRYSWQRITGYIAFVFIFMHVASLRWGWSFWGLMPPFDPEHAASSTAIHFQDGAWGNFAAVFYLVCVLSIVFHFANGLWTAAITWGLTISATSQQRWGYACAGIGMGLAAASVTAIVGFATLNPEKAEIVENEMKMKETPVMESEIAHNPG